MTIAHINRIGTAVPDHDVHATFIRFVEDCLPDRKSKVLFKRMAQRSDIEHRFSFFRPGETLEKSADDSGFYARGAFPGTAARMAHYETQALALTERAVDALDLGDERQAITHLVMASCTGFAAPGIDQQLIDRLGLDPAIERTAVGFMGCAAAVNALKLAHHIVRSEPSAKVLVVNLELCTLHFQETSNIEIILGALLFGDGCAATLVSAEPNGIALKDFRAATIPDSHDLITWKIGDSGFEMGLSGEVPARIARTLRQEAGRNDCGGLLRGQRTSEFDLWAVHAGGRTVLDAVEQGLDLDAGALRWSRGILRDFGNMSSATLMFVLDRMLKFYDGEAEGFGMAFGPGMVAETFRFRRVA